jgi:mono/diheme cytochrome c family protein
MRYFVTGFLLLCAAVVAVLGFRGDKSRRPPLEIFPDMTRQQKTRPESHSQFFTDDHRASRENIPGTVARDSAFESSPYTTGHITGTTNFIEVMPLAVTEKLMSRGRQRYQINCSPCHGDQGDGKGIISKYGLIPADLHLERLVRMGDGEIFNTIAYGKGLMGSYGANVPIDDRWAVVAYVRALQLSHLATGDDLAKLNDVPAEIKAALKK